MSVTSVKVSDGPPMLRSENGRPVTWIYVDSRGRDLQGLVQDIQRAIARDVKLLPSVSVSYTGQFEFLVRSEEHTSELQPLMSISYAVFCLNNKKNNTQTSR